MNFTFSYIIFEMRRLYFYSSSALSVLFFITIFLLSGQVQEVTLSQEEQGPQVEVTPELDLEVVPESSGDWHNVFPWSKHHDSLDPKRSTVCTGNMLSTDYYHCTGAAKTLSNIFLLSKGYLVEQKNLGDLLHCLLKGSTIVAMPCCFSD